MLKNQNIHVNPPVRCPKCREYWFHGVHPFGPASLITILDMHMPCAGIVLKGWVCGDLAFGTVIRRGPIAARGEQSPVDMISTDHSYILSLPSRDWDIDAI